MCFVYLSFDDKVVCGDDNKLTVYRIEFTIFVQEIVCRLRRQRRLV